MFQGQPLMMSFRQSMSLQTAAQSLHTEPSKCMKPVSLDTRSNQHVTYLVLTIQMKTFLPPFPFWLYSYIMPISTRIGKGTISLYK